MNERSSKGYTMAEMLVVLAIIAIMMLIVIPRLAFKQKGAGLKAAASDIMSAMRTARRLAITERVPYAVIFDLDTIPSRFFVAKYDSRFDPWVPPTITFPGPPTGPSTFSWQGQKPQTEEEADKTDSYRDTNANNQVDYPGPTGDYYLYTNWNMVGEKLRPLPDNIAITDIKKWANSGFGQDEPNFNVTRTEDNDLNGTLSGTQYIPLDPINPSCDGDGDTYYAEDTGIDGVLCTQDSLGLYAHDPGEHDGIITSVYRIIVFQPTGTSDKAIIHLWDFTDGRREVTSTTNLPKSLVELGYPPNLNPKYQPSPPPSQLQSDYFQIGSAASMDDVKYYTVVVNPITGGVTVYDYAWGEGGSGDWDRKKDGQ